MIKEAAFQDSMIFRKVFMDQMEFFVVMMPGQKVKKIVFALAFPGVLINRKLQTEKRVVLIFAVFIMFLSFSTFYLLRHLLFKPIDELKKGIDCFASRKFQNRLEVVCQNEMGELLQAFNESFENMQDLEVARIVQESVLPEPKFSQNNLEILAQTRVASKLGGDFFDIVKLDERRVLVFIGDATGHGVPAALTMGMAKSVIIHELNQKSDQSQIMQGIQKLFYCLRKQGARDLMTCTSIEIDTLSGEAAIINMGHPYPLFFSKINCSAKYLSDAKGLPPGFGKPGAPKIHRCSLESGDFLVLYTDGFIENTSDSGETFGFDNFADLIAQSNEKDLQAQIDKVFEAANLWQKNAEDDLTTIIIRMKLKNEFK
ncbi:MAG: PP2C family protein-serine/threonine phosphatase [Candidatus Rifleibacteriota bacterium]